MNRIKFFLAHNSLRIVTVFFLLNFIILLSIRSFEFPYTEIPTYLIFSFWLSLGLYVGYYIAREALIYLSKKKE